MTGAIDPVLLAQALVRCPSVTPAEGGALALLAEVLGGAGYTVHLPVFSEAGTPDVTNLFAKIGAGSPAFVFAGHTDVVPPGDASNWRHDPFSGAIEAGEVFGRGAVDMKGGIAAFVAAALSYGIPARGSIALLIAGDEEGPSVNGTAKLLLWAAERGEHFDHCLLGEPTNPDTLGDAIKIGRRGSLSGVLSVHGTQGHAAYPQLADNPIPKLLRLVSALLDPPLDAGSEHFERSNLEVVSVDVGNAAFNVIPEAAQARFNVRFNDHHSIQSLEDTLRARLRAAAGEDVRYDLEFRRGASDSFLTAPGPFVDLVADAVHARTGRRPELATNGGTSDARFIKDYCPVVEFGLVGRTMHQIDERVPVADLTALTDIYREVLQRYFSTPASSSETGRSG